MITVEVDCNSDVIRLKDNGREVAEYQVKYPDKMIGMLSEIFNRVAGGVDDYLAVELVKIDEDTRKQLEEW